MIRVAEAIEFLGVASSGRNAPLQVMAETPDGDLLELFVKPSGRPELGIEGLANELFAACIAGHVGLPVCEPIIVSIADDWINSISDQGLQSVLRLSSELAFGSLSAGTGWRIWAQEDRIVGSSRREPALGIFAFDAFTGNDDRRAEKPNLLVKGDEFRMIDHELCFKLRLKLFPRVAPWELGNLSHLTDPERHILGAALKGDHHLDIAALKPHWESLSDDALADYEAVIPDQWAAAAEPIAQAVTHLKTVRDRIDECLAEVQRVLA
jgi:hypothetical protein